MPTTIDNSQVENLRQYANRNMMVRADGDHFKVSSNNPFKRLIVWMQSKLLPASQTRQITEARERFIAAIGNRYGDEGRAAARDVLGASSRKPLRSRDIRQVFDTLDQKYPGLSGSPADGAPAFRMQVDAQAGQRGVNGPSPDPLSAGGSFYRELQEAGTGLCGMHALNAFCGGPVVGADEYKTMSIETTLDAVDVQGADREGLRSDLQKDFSSDPAVTVTLLAQLAVNGKVDPACTNAAVETGVTLPDAVDSPEAHAEVRARINAFPGDRLMVGYSRGDSGAAHMIALRREKDGHWQILDSLKASSVPPKRAANLADCLDALPKGLTIVHLEGGFSFRANVAAPRLESPNAAVDPAIDPAGVEVQGKTQADPLLEPYLDAGISTEHAQQLLAAKITPESAVRFLQNIAQKGDDPQDVFNSDIPLRHLRMVYRHGSNLHGARLLRSAKLLAPRIARDVYALHRIPIVEDTILRHLPMHMAQTAHVLGNGSFNTVYAVEHTDGVRRIFKPLTAPDPAGKIQIEHGWSAQRTGIDLYNPQTAVRNISTCRLAEELGFDVVVRTELGIQFLPGATEPQLGLVMESAPGRPAGDLPANVFSMPEVRRETTKLQLLDCLTAQGDRHSGNYFIGLRPDGSVRVAGIDNDQCLGSKVHNPDVIRRGMRNEPDWGFRSCGLPPVIDTDMAETLEKLTPERVRQLLDDILPPDEVAATVQRLTAIKQHVARLRQEGRVIAADAWAAPIVFTSTNYTNSYFQRESTMQLRTAALGNAAAALDAMGYY